MRELHNRIQRATLICAERVVRSQDFGLVQTPEPPAAEAAGKPREERTPSHMDPERATMEEALLKASGVVSKAAAELGMSRQAFYRRMERLGIVLERKPRM